MILNSFEFDSKNEPTAALSVKSDEKNRRGRESRELETRCHQTSSYSSYRRVVDEGIGGPPQSYYQAFGSASEEETEKREEFEQEDEEDGEGQQSSRKRTKKRRQHLLHIMGTLRGRLRKARKQITWCAFPLNRKRKNHHRHIDDDGNDLESLYESACDIPYGLSLEKTRLSTIKEDQSSKDVGHPCRGSVNLQDASVFANKTDSSIVISAASQTFHVKAQNETDRQEWLSALEYSRHKAIKRAESDEDEDAQMSTAETSRLDALALSNKQLASKLLDLKSAIKMMKKQSDDFIRDIETGRRSSSAAAELAEKSDLLKIMTEAVLQSADEFVEMSESGARKMGKIVAAEQKEKMLLQEQIEALAKQHSSLERAATFRSSPGAEQTPLSVYSDQEEEFHDAEEDLNPCDSRNSSQTHISNQMAVENGKVVEHRSGKVRRATIPERPDLPINLWSIMKNCIGKELSKIPMPVNFSEPISVLQRVTEDLEYAQLLEKASTLSSLEQMCYVAAYAASNYSTTGQRTNKPFNPLLGETFEFDRMEDLGWKSITEQVSHHPPAAAHHAEGNGWVMYQDFTMTSRFRGKFLSVIPVGYTHVLFPQTNSHFSYKKITTTVHNIIVGKLWIDNHGDMEITNHETGEKCILKFIPYSYFSREPPRRVYGIVRDAEGVPKYVVQGTWDKSIDMLKVSSWNENKDKPKVEVDEASLKRIWTINPLPPGSEKMHNFTKFAIEMNEPEDDVAPTDSRNRPDQRMMENGLWDEANKKKSEIEEKQRAVRRKREGEIEKAMQRGEPYQEYQPTWFSKVQDEINGALIHQYKGGYWEAKNSKNWSKCPDIF